MSFARVIVFALALIHAVGLADLVMDDACEEVCTDDGCGDDCLPGVACRCHCPTAMSALGAVAQTAAKIPNPREVTAFSDEQRMHASPDPLEILRVPKHAA